MKKTVVSMVIVLGMGLAACTNSTNTTTEIKQEQIMELSKKEKVVALLNSFNTGDKTPISYINPEKYIQHNLGVADGLVGFGAVMKHAPEALGLSG